MQCFKDLPVKTSLKHVFYEQKLTCVVQHIDPLSLVKFILRSRSQQNLEQIFWDLKHMCLAKSVFSWHLGQLFRCFEWKYCAFSKSFISMSGIYLHFSHCMFLIFCLMDWFRFQKSLVKGPILDLAEWTGFLTKYSEFNLCVYTSVPP